MILFLFKRSSSELGHCLVFSSSFLCGLFKGSLCRYAGGPSSCLQRGRGGVSSSSHGCPSIKSLKSYINQYIGLSGPPTSFKYLYTAKEGQMPIYVPVLFKPWKDSIKWDKLWFELCSCGDGICSKGLSATVHFNFVCSSLKYFQYLSNSAKATF